MRPTATLLALFCLLATGPAALADLAGDVARELRGTPKGARVAVHLVRLGEAEKPVELYAKDADEPMIPASNLKLLTTAAALDLLGPDFRFQTKLYARLADDGVAEVAVVGGGDPSFGDSELLETAAGWGPTTIFDSWAGVLARAGVREVAVLYLDDSVFDDDHDHPNWPSDQKHLWYEAQVGGLNLNLNCVDVHLRRDGDARLSHRLDPPTGYVAVDGSVRRGKTNAVLLTRKLGTNDVILGGQTPAREQGPMKVTVDDPTAYFGRVFAERLENAGLPVAFILEHDGVVETPSEWSLLAIHETAMPTILARTNKDSINLYAECLLKRIGHEATGESGSWANGDAAVKAYLGRIGVDSAGAIHLDDGSGMSRQNRVTAEALTAVLAQQFQADTFEAFRAGLSEAGADGTLRRRFATRDRLALRGRVFGKTGYINNVSTMSGYLHGRDGAWYAFSILVNDARRSDIGKAKTLQEAIVDALDDSLTPAPLGNARQ